MNNAKQAPQSQQLNVKIDEKISEGVYANFLMVVNNQSEYILDFGRLVPGVKEAKIFSRVITTPQHAKQFIMTMKQNLDMYEKQFGEIKIPKQQNLEHKNIGFHTPTKHEGEE